MRRFVISVVLIATVGCIGPYETARKVGDVILGGDLQTLRQSLPEDIVKNCSTSSCLQKIQTTLADALAQPEEMYSSKLIMEKHKGVSKVTYWMAVQRAAKMLVTAKFSCDLVDITDQSFEGRPVLIETKPYIFSIRAVTRDALGRLIISPLRCDGSGCVDVVAASGTKVFTQENCKMTKLDLSGKKPMRVEFFPVIGDTVWSAAD